MLIVLFFFNDTATTEIYTLSLHDALPIYRLLEGQARIAPALEELTEIDALDELHHQVLAALVVEVVDHLHHAGVVERGEQARLDVEARGVAPVGEPLERDVASVLGVVAAVDRAHGPARD